MLLKKLIFDNYKTYYGHQDIDLYIPKEVREHQGKNIILLGGLNGAGKTTILKAILYVLFGKRGLSESEYKRLFSNVINNTFFSEGGRECSVSLILETDSEEEWDLRVKWYFDKYKRMTHEERELKVKKTGFSKTKHARIENIEVFNKFIDRIIPFHAAPFFIFDGEEIKDIILRQNSNEMKEAIQKITGMEAYKQLLADLRTLKTTLENKLSKAVSKSLLSNINIQKVKLDTTIKELEEKRDIYLSKKRNLDSLIKDAKDERNNKLSQNSKSREVFIQRQSRISTELELATNELNNFLKDNIIFIILGEKISELKKQLKNENEVSEKRILQNASLQPYHNFISQLLNKSITPPLSDEQIKQIKKLGEEVWVRENHIRYAVPDDFTEIHDLTNNEYNYLLNVSVRNRLDISKLINKIERSQQDLTLIEAEIINAPSAVNIDNENEKIDLLVKKVGVIDNRLRVINSKIRSAIEERTNLLNKATRLSGQDENYEDVHAQLENVTKTITAMDQYITEVVNMKALFIKEQFAFMLKKLFRKQEEFGKIEFDINTYTIRLFNDQMQEISVQERSAGEMQMISSALIWALTKSSDLSLPMIIDTPLGRLDSYHRNHLINHYYKELSEQVIILSTDTEITEEYIALMEGNSYKQYMLDYNESKKYTIVRDGYFDFVRGD